MQVIRRFNNNVVLCVDNNGNELVAFGKALGFHEIPYTLTDVSKIERSYYGIENRYLNMINDLSEKSLEISGKVLDWCRTYLEGRMNPNMLFTMADHIDFSIERFNRNFKMGMPLYENLEILHPIEYQIATKAVNLINESFGINLPNEEIIGITMNIINAELDLESNRIYKDIDKIMIDLLNIIEDAYNITIDTTTVSYARYVSHIKYLMVRIDNNEDISDSPINMYHSISKEYPKALDCANTISDYLIRNKNHKLNKDEIVYLIIHINRLCSREEYIKF